MLTQEVPFKGLLGVQIAWLVVVEGEVNFQDVQPLYLLKTCYFKLRKNLNCNIYNHVYRVYVYRQVIVSKREIPMLHVLVLVNKYLF